MIVMLNINKFISKSNFIKIFGIDEQVVYNWKHRSKKIQTRKFYHLEGLYLTTDEMQDLPLRYWNDVITNAEQYDLMEILPNLLLKFKVKESTPIITGKGEITFKTYKQKKRPLSKLHYIADRKIFCVKQ